MPDLQNTASALADALERLAARRPQAAWSTGVPEEALANATPYLQAFGHVVLAWIWLDVALRLATRARHAGASATSTAASSQAARYFFRYELPKIDAWLALVESRDTTCRDMQDSWF